MEIRGQQERLRHIPMSVPCRQQGSHQGKKQLLQKSYSWGDPRLRWSTIRVLLQVTETKTCQRADESRKLCNTSVAFFNDQGSYNTAVFSQNPTAESRHGFTGWRLHDLQLATEDDAWRLISTMPNKSSPLNCIPTSVIKSCADVFAPLITY